MQLVEAIFTLERMTPPHVICARSPFVASSEALIVELAEDYALPGEVTNSGYLYFLGAEDLSQLLSRTRETLLSRDDQVAVICHFATHDAYPEWFNLLCSKRSMGAGNAI